MASDLQKLIYRWDNIDKFIVALFTKLCEQVIVILVKETPGTTLPLEWVHEINVSGGKVTAEIRNARLDNEPGFEQVLIWLDLGTVDHWIFPVTAQALSWVDHGIRYFSKGHMVSGIKASNFHAKATIAVLKFRSTAQRKFSTYMNTGRLP